VALAVQLYVFTLPSEGCEVLQSAFLYVFFF